MGIDLSAPVRVATSPISLGLRALAWGILSLAGFTAAFVAVGSLVSLAKALGMSHAVTLGVWALAWVPASGLLVLPGARVALGTWLEVRTAAWVVLLLGALVSAAHIWLLVDWAIARYGYSDPDFIGATFSLFAAVAGVAVAGFGVQVGPRWAVWVPMLALVGGVALAIPIMASNIPGLADGLGADSGPLAAATVAAAVYIGAVGILSIKRLRRG